MNELKIMTAIILAGAIDRNDLEDGFKMDDILIEGALQAAEVIDHHIENGQFEKMADENGYIKETSK